MLCDNCKKNQATVHIIKVVNGKKEEMNLCEACAREKQGFDITGMGNIDFNPSLTFQNILGGIMDYISGAQVQPNQTTQEPVCKTCGMTYNEFKQSGLLGCNECYKNFGVFLDPIIKRVQNGTEHVGKIPKKSSGDIIGKRRFLKLKEDLQKAIALEEYEKAAQIRDAIRDLKKNE